MIQHQFAVEFAVQKTEKIYCLIHVLVLANLSSSIENVFQFGLKKQDMMFFAANANSNSPELNTIKIYFG